MMELRRAGERGHAEHGWLDSWHSFSFADYHDPEYMQFRALRVINEDRVEPGRGFGTHSHRDMEIISYVLEGTLAHQDSMGNGSVIRPGSVQCMSAGTGVQHSEFNASSSEQLHFLQIWFIPNVTGIPPGYEEKYFDDSEKRGGLRLIASPDGADNSVTIHADVKSFAGLVNAGESIEWTIATDRFVYVYVARGRVSLNGTPLHVGDAARLTGESHFVLDRGRKPRCLFST